LEIGKVYLDTEHIDFEGEPPKSVLDLWALVEVFLSQSNRVIDEFIIDGAAWSPDLGEHPQSCSEIMIVSVSEDEKAVQLVDQLLGEEEKLTGLWRSGAQESLRGPGKTSSLRRLAS